MRAFALVLIPASGSSLAFELFQIVHRLRAGAATHLAGGLQTGTDGRPARVTEDHAAIGSIELDATYAGRLS